MRHTIHPTILALPLVLAMTNACVVSDGDDDTNTSSGTSSMSSTATSTSTSTSTETATNSSTSDASSTSSGQTDSTGTLEPIVVDCAVPLSTISTWVDDPNRPVDYSVNCLLSITGPSTLIIEQGTSVAFGPGAGLHVDGGKLVTKGSAERPVKLAAANDTQPWRGVTVFGDIESQFSYTHFRGAGAQWEAGSAALLVGAPSFNQGIASIRDCVFEGSVGYGIAALAGQLTAFERNTVSNSAHAALLSVDTIGQIPAGNTWTNNASNQVDVVEAIQPLETAKTWPNLEISYAVNGPLRIGGANTIAAGTHIKMLSETATLNSGNGKFIAHGTAEEPIVIDGTNWNSVYLTSPDNSFQHVHFSGASALHNPGDQRGMLTLDADTGSTVEIRDCVFEGATGWGIWLGNSSVNADVDTVNTFRNNALGNIHR